MKECFEISVDNGLSIHRDMAPARINLRLKSRKLFCCFHPENNGVSDPSFPSKQLIVDSTMEVKGSKLSQLAAVKPNSYGSRLLFFSCRIVGKSPNPYYVNVGRYKHILRQYITHRFEGDITDVYETTMKQFAG